MGLWLPEAVYVCLWQQQSHADTAGAVDLTPRGYVRSTGSEARAVDENRGQPHHPGHTDLLASHRTAVKRVHLFCLMSTDVPNRSADS